MVVGTRDLDAGFWHQVRSQPVAAAAAWPRIRSTTSRARTIARILLQSCQQRRRLDSLARAASRPRPPSHLPDCTNSLFAQCVELGALELDEQKGLADPVHDLRQRKRCPQGEVQRVGGDEALSVVDPNFSEPHSSLGIDTFNGLEVQFVGPAGLAEQPAYPAAKPPQCYLGRHACGERKKDQDVGSTEPKCRCDSAQYARGRRVQVRPCRSDGIRTGRRPC